MTAGIILAVCGIAAIYIGVADGGDPGFLRAGIVLVLLGALLPLLKFRADRASKGNQTTSRAPEPRAQ